MNKADIANPKRRHGGTKARDASTYRYARRQKAKLDRCMTVTFCTVGDVMNRFHPAPAWCSVPNFRGNRHQRRRLRNKKVLAQMMLQAQQELVRQGMSPSLAQIAA